MTQRQRVAAVMVGIAGIISAACSATTSTEPNVLNVHPGVPTGWVQASVTSATYVIGTDNNTVHGGGTALVIAGTDTSRVRFQGISQFVRADNYRGKRIRLRGWIRQSGIDGTLAGLWMRIDGPGVVQGFDNFTSRPQLGTSGWHQVEIILDVPINAIGIGFGALMSARGELFVDDMTFDVIPADGPTTNQLAEFLAGTDSATQVANYARDRTAPINLDFESR